MAELGFSLPKLDVRTLPGPDTVTKRELPNGLVILVRENFLSPSVIVSGYLKAGSLGETRKRAGLAHLTALAMMRGTQTRSFHEIFETIESIGARLSLGAGMHVTLFQGKALVEDMDLVMDLLADVLRNPVFPKTQVDRLKAEQDTALAIRDQNTGAMAQLAFDELAYPKHPYSLPTAGFRDTVTIFASEDLSTFHSKHYGPQGMVIAIVGAVKAEAAVDAVENTLGDWVNPQQLVLPPIPTIDQPSGLLRKELPLFGKTQCDLVLGAPGPSRFDEKYMAAALGNSILGRFGLYGRIGDAVRESAGLAYYAYSVMSAGPGPGPWEVVAGVNPTGVERAVELIRDELKRFVTERVTKQELNDNQTNFIGRLPLQLESNEGVAGALMHIERYDLGMDYYKRYPNIVSEVTREHVLQVARQYLDPDHLAIAIAGPTKEKV